MTKNDLDFHWLSDEQSAFNTLRMKITSAPILALPNNSKPFCIEADSSYFATGAVLSQQGSDNDKWHPVEFLSKSLSPVERNHEIYDKEILAIVRALEEWRHFVEGVEHQVEIWTDHENFMTAKKLNQRQAHWSFLLARFDFVMHHRPGKTMGKSDALSQRSDHGSGAKDNDNMVLLTPNFLAVRALEGLQVTGEERDIPREIRREMETGSKEEVVVTSLIKSVKSAEWSLENGILYH